MTIGAAPATPSPSAISPPTADDSRAAALRIATTALFAIYSAPLFLLALSGAVSGGWRDTNLILQAFIGFTQSQNQSLAMLHRSILPLMGAFAPLAFKGSHTDRWATVLMCLLLTAIAVSLALDGLFNADTIQDHLKALGVFPVPGTTTMPTSGQAQVAFASGMALIDGFFNRTQEVLGMYLLLLFGLKATDASAQGQK